MNKYLDRYPFLRDIPEVVRLFKDADVVDPKSIEAPVSLHEFIVGILGYRPWLLKFLFRVRDLFARLLGLRATGVPEPIAL